MASRAVIVKQPAEIIPTVSPGGMKLRSVIETPPRRTAKWDHCLSAHESDRTSPVGFLPPEKGDVMEIKKERGKKDVPSRKSFQQQTRPWVPS